MVVFLSYLYSDTREGSASGLWSFFNSSIVLNIALDALALHIRALGYSPVGFHNIQCSLLCRRRSCIRWRASVYCVQYQRVVVVRRANSDRLEQASRLALLRKRSVCQACAVGSLGRAQCYSTMSKT